MNEFSGLAESLFGFIVESSLSACIVVLAICLLQRVFRARFTPRWHYLLWTLLILRLMVPWTPASPFSVQGLFRFASSEMAAWHSVDGLTRAADSFQHFTNAPAGYMGKQAGPPIASEAPLATGHPALNPGLIITSAWLAGCLLFSLHILLASFCMSRSLRGSQLVINPCILDIFEACKRRMKVRVRPTLLSNDRLPYPIVHGVIRPRLVMPESMLNSLSEDELRHVFLHELGHLKRHDLVVGLLTAGLQATHWFNPLVWYGFHRMRQDREMACDALALSRMSPREADDYGHTLIKLMENRVQRVGMSGAAAILEQKSQLTRRIEMIAQRKASPYRLSWMSLSVIAICALSLLTRAAEPPSKPQTLASPGKGNKATAILVAPQADRIDADVRKEWLAQGVSSEDAIRAKLCDETIGILEKRVGNVGLKGVLIAKTSDGRISVTAGAAGDCDRLRGLVLQRGGLSFCIVAKPDETAAALAALDTNPKFTKRLTPLLTPGKDSERLRFAADNLETVRTLIEEINSTPNALPEGKQFALGRPELDTSDWILFLIEQDSGMSGITVSSATAAKDSQSPGHACILIEFSPEDGERFGRLTEANINRELSIIMAGIVQSAPTIRSKITTGGQIAGNFTLQEAGDLAAIIRTRPLPAPLVEEDGKGK